VYPFWDLQILLRRVPGGLVDYQQDAFLLSRSHFPGEVLERYGERLCTYPVGRISQWTFPLLGRAKA
jgi:hypothetical protein